jgi:hypothetical protein
MKASVPPAAFALLFCVTGMVPSAWADSITTLFNTGVDTDESLLPDGGVDPHYTLIESGDTGYPGPDAYTLRDPSEYPFHWLNDPTTSLWMSNTSTSKWITPSSENYTFYAEGYYTYETTFYLPQRFNPKKDTAFITGLWATDNTGMDIVFNGMSTGNFIPYGAGNPPTNPWSFQSFLPFSIATGFDRGWNTLDFVIWNDGGSPTGIQVQMTGTYDLKPIPEPSTLGLVCIGILGLIGWRRGR